MNVTLNKIDAVNAAIKVEVAQADYTETVEKNLKKLRQSAVIPGFRKGMVPMSRIQAMYGKSVLLEEVNKLVVDKLYEYIREEKLQVLGEPLPDEKQEIFNLDDPKDFAFVFDIGLAPEINVTLDKSDKLPYYKIKISDEMIDRQIESYKASFGDNVLVEEAEERDLIRGDIAELDETGAPKEGGIAFDNAVLMYSYIKDEAEKAKFVKAKVGNTVVFNPFKAYEGHEAELSSLLKIKKEEVKQHTGDFSLKITEISRYKEAEVDQTLFDKVFGEGNVKSLAGFRKKVAEVIEEQFDQQVDYRFLIDVRDYLTQKVGALTFPETFLKRWLLNNSKERTPESVEADYPKIEADLKFQLIWDKLAKDYEINITDEDIKDEAKKATREQFVRYGMGNMPDQLIENYAQEMLKKEESVRNLADKALESKMIDAIKQHITLQSKSATVEEFADTFKTPEEKAAEKPAKKPASKKAAKADDQKDTTEEKPKKTTKKSKE